MAKTWVLTGSLDNFRATREHGYVWKVPPVRGIYDVTLTATDLAGNTGRSTGVIEVLRRKPPAAQDVSAQP